MPPSTVFSYWRRDHRRSSASPVHQQQQQQPTSASPKADNPPQLPVIPNTPDLTTSIGESPGISDGSGSNTTQRPSEENPPPLQPQHWDQNQTDRLNVIGTSSNSRAQSSSATNLTVPLSSLEKQPRPHSSPEERERASSVLTAQSNYSQSNYSQSSFAAAEGDSSSKPSSPFRLSFGKSTPSTDSNKNVSTTATPGTVPPATSRSNNTKSSPEGSPADKPAISRKDSKLERSNSRRNADRDGSSEHAHHKSGKAMLHLLNPMSLLARRRSSRMAGSKADDMKIGVPSLVPAIPDDYDPRIRGNIVHDFSAPRPRRNLAATPSILQDKTSQPSASDSPQNPQNPQNGNAPDSSGQASEQKAKHGEYSPAFKEHFEDDQKVLQVENKGYLQSPLLTNQPHHDGEHSLPVFARKLPSKIPEQEEEQTTENQPEPDLEPQQQQPVLDSNPPPESTKKEALPPVDNEEDTVVDMPQPPSGLPRHFKSNASRFSFDMTGMESSVQEKILEEKHKEKEAARRSKYGSEYGEYSDVDDFDEDLLDDMDGLEEKIPGVNVDADEDELDGFSGSGNMMSRSWLSPGLSPIIGSPASPAPPNLGGLPNVQGGPAPAETIQNSYFPSMNETAAPGNNVDIPLQETNAKEPSTEQAPVPLGAYPGVSQPVDDDDDLYFDDGEFGDLSADVGGDDEAQKFDESIFDDETSHLYERKKKQAEQPTAPVDNEEQGATKLDDASSEDEEGLTEDLADRTEGLKHAPSMASEYRGPVPKAYGSLTERASNLGSAKAHGGVLSEHNLEALHNALTKAAAGNDRYEGTESASDGQESAAQTTDSHPGLVSDNSRLSQAMDAFGSEEVFEDFDYDDADSSLYDDPIIAAANAEALENDDDGFYGEEFGFYAHAHVGAQLTNGGYFGPRGVEGITRNFSSRGKFREPSLTPITERSERSTRNSVISLTAAHGPGHSNPSVSSPGLAQLVDLGNLDDEMSFSALMKLRRGAWGGSNGSLRSSSASPPPAPYPHSASNRGSFTALSDASPTVQAIPADLIWPGSGSAIESPVRDPERNGSSTASPV